MKLFTTAITFVTILALFTVIPAFGQDKPFAGKTISFWMQRYGADPANQDAAMKKITDAFEAKTGAKVNVVYVDWGQALTKYTLASSGGGEAPDTAECFFLASLVKIGNGTFGPMPINDLAKEIGMEKYYPGLIHEVKVGADFYGVPWRADTRVLAYNSDLFDAAGIKTPPKTWDELVTYGKKLTKSDAKGNVSVAGLLWSNLNARFDQTWFSVVAQAGGKVFSDDMTKPIFDSKQSLESLQFMQDLVSKYKISPKNIVDPSFDSMNEFMAGKAAMLSGATAEFAIQIAKNAPQLKGKIKAAVLPSKSGSGPSSVAYAAPVVVFRQTKEPAVSKAWVKFFTSDDNQLAISKALSLLNSNRNVMSSSFFKNDPWLSVFIQQFERTQMGDMPLPTWGQIDAFPGGPLATMTSEVMAGQDVNKAVQKALVAVKTLMLP